MNDQQNMVHKFYIENVLYFFLLYVALLTTLLINAIEITMKMVDHNIIWE